MEDDYRDELEESVREVIASRRLPLNPNDVSDMSDTALTALLEQYVDSSGSMYAAEDFELPSDPEEANRLLGLTYKPKPPEPGDWRERLDRLDQWDTVADAGSSASGTHDEPVVVHQDKDPET